MVIMPFFVSSNLNFLKIQIERWRTTADKIRQTKNRKGCQTNAALKIKAADA